MMDKITPVLLAGGSGSRLWPLSRKSNPKQFKKLSDKFTLFQKTILRFNSTGKLKFDEPITITNSDYRFLVLEQFKNISRNFNDILLEPTSKNTAPAILAASIFLNIKKKNSIILMNPTDHLIPDSVKFHKLLEKGMIKINKGQIVIFGVNPTRPEKGYGYLKLKKNFDKINECNVDRFIEKPSQKLAEKFIMEGNYFWNSGLVLFRTNDLNDAFKKLHPRMFSSVEKAVLKGQRDLEFFRLDHSSWSRSKNISIDYALLEKITNLSAVIYKGLWSDLGDWNSVWEINKKINNGVVKSENVTEKNCENVLLRSEDKSIHLVGLGLKDIIAVAMKDTVLVADKSRSQEVKDVVKKLKSKNIFAAENFLKDFRPWGWFEILTIGENFKVKKIFVNPNSSLSLQSHKFRSEHWVVVQGVADVVVDDLEKTLNKGESAFISVGSVHRLSNNQKEPLILIEVQTGSYLGEDDIIRYSDNYGRSLNESKKLK